jgi:hypothetical protein
MVNEHRKHRIADFQRRAAFAPETVLHHANEGWPYIPVHHFADETDRVVSRVDCWCLLGADAALLECILSNESPQEPGFYARVDAEKPCWPKLQAVLSAQLTKSVVEFAMQRFVKLGFPDGLTSRLPPGGPLVRLAP